jgi:hypothetical protein
MILCAAGDVHGAIDRFYRDVLTFEESLGVSFAHVLHVGDFGIWPDENRVDRATRNHDGAGDFPAWFAASRAVPRPTVFIKGNHEDFDWLEERRRQKDLEILPGLRILPNGTAIDLESNGESIHLGGIGGCFGPSNYGRRAEELRGRARRHFTRDEVDRLCGTGPLDVLLLHDAPGGVEFTWKRKDSSIRRQFSSEAEGLARVVADTRPTVCFFGHHHTRLDAEIEGIPCIGLNKVGCPGSLVAIDFRRKARTFSVLGEWPIR